MFLFLSNTISQILTVVVNIVLARLLFPSDFGLIVLSTTFIGFISLFTTLGLGSAIIYKQDTNEIQLSTLYWLNLIFFAITFVVIIILVPFAANFYNEPFINKITIYSAISILITPFYVTHYKLKERNLEFKILSIIVIISTFLGAVSAIVSAYMGMGVYALVIQILVSTFAKLILVLNHSSWKPQFVFNYDDVKEMIWYSIKYKISTIFLFLERNIDYLILGKLFAATILGYYAFAYNIMYTPVRRISYIFGNVLFPSFSAVKDKNKIIIGYFESIRIISMISFPVMTILAFNAELIVQTIFGDKWDNAIPIVQILSFAGAIQSLGQFGDVIFPSIGKPEIGTYIAMIRTILVTIAIIVGSNYGILVVSYGLAIAKIISMLTMFKAINYCISYSYKKLMSYLKGSLAVVGSLFMFQFISIRYLPNLIPEFKLIIMIILSILIILKFYYFVIKDITHKLIIK